MLSYLPVLFIVLFLLGFLLAIIGLVSPKVSLFWRKGKRSRKFSTLFYGFVTLFSFIMIFVSWFVIESIDDSSYSSRPEDPKSKEASGLAGKGRVYYDKDQLDSALLMFTKVIELKPDTADYSGREALRDAYRYRASIYVTRNKYDLALADDTERIKLDPKGASGYQKRGGVYELMGNNELAFKDFDQMVRLDSSASNFLVRAEAYLRQKDYPKAEQDYKNALAIDKNSVKILSSLASLSEKMHDYPQAVKYYDTIMGLDPGNAHMLGHRALIKGVLKDFGNALAEVNSAIKMDPKMGELYDQRGRIKYDSGADGYCEDFRTAVKLGEDEKDIMESCGCN